MAASEPQQFGEFAVIEKLGQGAMGAVYKARQTSLNRIVALKLLPAHYAGNADFLMRFKNEAMAAAALNHPHIVQVYAAGEDNGTHFFAMEFVEGESLGGRMERKGCIEPREAIAVACHLAQALDYAWKEAKVIHRDIKPDNIFLSKNGMVKLGDLGLAKLLGNESSVTQTGAAMGTPYYVSPEQAMGKKEIDFRADIYSLGCTIFHAMTGQPPYRGESAMAVMMMHISQPPPKIQEVWPQCPPPIIGLLDRMLRKRPEERHESYEALLQQLYWVAARLEENAPEVDAAAASLIVPMPAPQTGSTPDASRKSAPKGTAAKTAPPSGGRGKMFAIVGGIAAAAVIGLFAWQPWKKAVSPAPVAADQTENPAPQIPPTEKSEPPTPPPKTAPATAATNTGASPSIPAPAIPTPAPIPVPASESPIAKQLGVTKDTPFVNTLGMKFVPVPGTQALFSIWDTRVQDYTAYARTNNVDDQWATQQKDGVPVGREPEHPVLGVSWEDANTFCKWLTEKESAGGTLPKGMKYRLPTDEEWSRAVGLPEEEGATPKNRSQKDKADFPWGNGYPPTGKVGNYADETFHTKFPTQKAGNGDEPEVAKDPKAQNWIVGYNDGFATTSPVGSFPANANGLYDMGGNAWQWCEDWYDTEQKFRVLRGGSWIDSSSVRLLSSVRTALSPRYRGIDRSFRCVLDVGGPAKTTASEPPKVESPTPPATIPKPQSETEKWLAQMDAIYLPMYQRDVTAPFESGLAELKKAYLVSLDRESASASRAAKLNDALAFRHERQRIEADSGVPPNDLDNPPAALKSLRAAYRAQSARLEADRRKHAATVFEQYDKVLATNQNALTQRQRLDEALLLQQRRAALANEWGNSAPGTTRKPAAPPAGNLAVTMNEKPFVNSLGMKFVSVPGTNVLFCIHETRYKDYAAYAAEMPGVDGYWKNQTYDGFTVTDRAQDHPVVFVSWEDAHAFCAWLSKKDGKTYRLPTDKEWSIAVGIGSDENWNNDTTPETVFKNQAAFPWRDNWPPANGAGNYSDQSRKVQAPNAKTQYIEGFNDGFPTTAPVMSFKPNRFGLYDMGGNVKEWCEDWYDASKTDRVIRDSSWDDFARSKILSSFRTHIGPAHRGRDGFRCVVEGASVTAESVSEPSVTPPPIPNPTLRTPNTTPAAANVPQLQLTKATKQQPFINSLGMKFVPVPGTEVILCIHETRRQDYAAYANEVPDADGAWKNQNYNGIPCGDKDDHPVVGMNWDDAQKFCAWLSKKEGRTYRLPSDKEWSLAVGLGGIEKWAQDTTPETLSGKDQTVYPWGPGYPPKTADRAGNYPDSTWHDTLPSHPEGIRGYTDGFATTAPVMSFKANKLGIYDMGGNAWEWCDDWWNAEQKDRVLRGGSFAWGGRTASVSSYRSHQPPANRSASSGFRCAMWVGGGSSATQPSPRAPASTPASVPPSPAAPTPAVANVPQISLAKATRLQPFVNSLGMKFVPVPDTNVLFCTHITRKVDYAAYAADVPGVDDAWETHPKDKGGTPIDQGNDYPVIGVNWADAQGFCAWLSRKEGLTYRLPTDREWSCAVGIGDLEKKNATPKSLNGKVKDVYPWGSQWPPPMGAGNYADKSFVAMFPDKSGIPGYSDGYPLTSPVFAFKPNKLGLYDMGGNCFQWCEDWMDEHQKERTLRGGHFSYSGSTRERQFELSSNRIFWDPGVRLVDDTGFSGFRCVVIIGTPAK